MSILWNPTEATVVEKVSLPVITTGTQNMGDGIYWLKAGTPLDEDLAVSNDGDAVYIVAEDFFFISTNPNQDRHVPLVKAGYVDLNKAEAAAGITYADAAVAALKTAGIILVDGLLDSSDANELPDVGDGDKNKFLHTKKTNGDLEWKQLVIVFSTNDLGSGSFSIDASAYSVFGDLYEGVYCVFISPAGDVGVLLGAKNDLTEFYALYNGSIITFAAESGDDNPTYAP